MKKALLLLASSALLLAGCQKEMTSANGTSGDEVTLEIEAGVVESGTKATIDYDGNAAKANHWIMEVRDAQGLLFYRQEKDAPEGTLKQTFKVTLIKNQTYDLLFWADNNTGNYNTDDLTNVKLIDEGTYVANDDARDAFSTCKTYKSTATEKISAQLYRPFAQVNIMTNELATLWSQAQTTPEPEITYAKFAPSSLILRAMVPTSFNVQTQLCGDISATDVVMTAGESYTGYEDDKTTKRSKNNYLRHISPATLFMDYIFASKGQNDIVDMEFSFISNAEKVEHVFTSIPLQRNYRTNILGNLLSNEATWEVEIIPVWEQPDYDIDVFEATVSNIEQLNEVLSSTSSTESEEITATVTMPTDSDSQDVTFTASNNNQVVNINFTGELGAGKTLRFKNDPSANGPATLNIVAPAGTNLVFANEMTHVIINGESYENISGEFSAHSLVIEKGVVVKNLSIAAGGLEIHGTVNNVEVTGTPKTVFVRSCEGLSEAVYSVLKTYIAKGFCGVEAEGKWNIQRNDTWEGYAAFEYSSKDESSKTIVIGSAEQFALFANEVNAGNTYEGWTIKLKNDIEMGAHTFTPIGNYTDNTPFKGTFDGQGNYIKGIVVYSKDKKGCGVFGKVYAPCVIKNLNVIDAIVTAEGTNTYTGGLVGHGYATITNCKFQGDIYAGNQVGGIAASGGFTITGCTFEGEIYCKYGMIGGIIGNYQDGGAISNNVAKGKIIANCADDVSFYGGGIIGSAIYTSCEVKGNYSEMDITFNGEKVGNYPIMGPYNIDEPTTDPNKNFENLLTKVADNTWDKALYTKKSYSIDYNVVAPSATDYFINYNDATTKLVLATIGGREFYTVGEAVEAAAAGEVVKVYGSTEFTKADDGFCYQDVQNKKGRLVYLSFVNAGSKTVNATFKISTNPALTLTFQQILLGSESRLDAPGSYLKSGDVIVLPCKPIYLDQGVIYDVYGDITFLGMKDKTIIYPFQSSNKSYRFFRIYNRYKDNITNNVIYNYTFKDVVFDGCYTLNKFDNLFVVTCYNIAIKMSGCKVTNFPGSVFSIWANDTLSDGSYPAKADNVGVTVNIDNSILTGNGRLVYYDCSPYQARDIDQKLDRYAFIHVNYDPATVVLNNNEMYSFNENTAKGQGNCLLNGVDVRPSE